MAIVLSRDTTIGGQVGTGGIGTPITKSIQLDSTGGTEITAAKTFYVVATEFYYDSISLEVVTPEAGITYELSLNNATWVSPLSISDLNALATPQSTPVYIRTIVVNDGTASQPVTGSYTGTDIRLVAVEHPVVPAP